MCTCQDLSQRSFKITYFLNMPSMQVGGICADFASAAGQLCYADMEATTKESEQVLAKNQGWTRKLIL